MGNESYAIAVIDIGMTNKKLAIYDADLRQLDAKYRTFEPIIVNDLQCHDLEGMEEWFFDELKSAGKKFPIKAIAVSTHGATFVCMGKNGKAALPCVLYTHEPGKDFHKRFYERFGKAVDLQLTTGTAPFEAMINPAKGIFFAQEQFPQEYKNVSAILPYPQYWGFRLTGKAGAENTYMGCHTYLWDQVNSKLSSVARDMGITELLPVKLARSWDVLGKINAEAAARTGLSPETIVTMGIHDSNASLLPHFAKRGETGFTLNSTGTWCVMMNPVKEYGFAPDELGKAVFFNISAFGTPVKTSIFLGGREFETGSKILMTVHQRNDYPAYDDKLYREILQQADCFLEQLPGKELPACFANYERGFAVLNISLVMQSLVALERAGLQTGSAVITEGGFRQNDIYNLLLSSALKGNKVYLTSILEATALGAAMTAKMALTGKSLAELSGDFEVDYQEAEKSNMPELFSYRKAWMQKVSLA